MQAFRTLVTADKPPFNISYADKLISIGSCFSENIGKYFKQYKYNIVINPFGQQYNPYSVATAIYRLISADPYSAKELVQHDELFHSFDHHGSYSKSTEAETLEYINTNLQLASAQLKNATVLFLTFGTSHVFRLKENNKIVSNCHKLSGNYFTRDLLKPSEITAILQDALNALWKVNPGIKVVLTISPVRYFAFGVHENSVSKAYLFAALQQLQEQNPQLYYFPAYEMVMDDLRDYRFFAEDMLHPNYQATQYVWEGLCNTMISKQSTELMKDVNEILAAASHRPRNPQSDAHKNFIKKYMDKMEVLQKKYELDFSTEKSLLSKYL
jgi:hypothetical protein